MLRVVKTPGRKQEVAKGGLHDVASDMTQLLCIVCVRVACARVHYRTLLFLTNNIHAVKNMR